MANPTRENENTSSCQRVPATSPSDLLSYRSEIVVNINDNSGTVVVGDNNVINVPSPAPSSTTGLQRDALFASWNENSAKGSDPTICGSVYLESISKFFAVRKSGHKPHYRRYVREKRKCLPGAATENPRNKQSNRKRIKRQRCNSGHSTSSSGDDWRDATLNERSLENDSSSFQRALEIYHSCITSLHPLLYNGRWAEFENRAQELLHLKTDGDVAREIIILLEKSVVLSLKRDLQQSEDTIYRAVKKIKQSSGSVRLLLEVLSNCYLAMLYRRRKLLGKTEKCLKTARRIASGFPPCLPVVFLLYEEGSLYKETASFLLGPRPKDPAAVEAKKLFQSCINLCLYLDRNQIYVRKQHLAVSKLASINFHCETSLSRSNSVSQKMVEEGRKSLETLQTEHYSSKETRGTKIQRLIAKVDLFYRLAKFRESQTVAQEALEMAETLEYNLDVMRLQGRLADIRRRIAESASAEAFRAIPAVIDSCSGSSKNNTPYSSEYDGNDWLSTCLPRLDSLSSL